MTAATKPRAPLVNLECVIPSCAHDLEGVSLEEAVLRGWRSIRRSEGPPGRKWRTHLGWCDSCAEKYSVER